MYEWLVYAFCLGYLVVWFIEDPGAVLSLLYYAAVITVMILFGNHGRGMY